MPRQFTLEYWQDGGWYVGRLTEVPGVFSQGETLENLEDNIRDAYRMMMEANRDTRTDARRTEITVDV
jgi:predicted RNase H-like HicB family nuclease